MRINSDNGNMYLLRGHNNYTICDKSKPDEDIICG
jgi:hypothetical protein